VGVRGVAWQVALPAVWCANARQVLGYEREAKPYLTRCVLVQCVQVSVVLILIAMTRTFYLEPLPTDRSGYLRKGSHFA